MSATNSNVKKASQFFYVVRQPYGYDIYEKISRTLLGKLMVVNSAPDNLNSMLRDSVLNAYYEYGKNLGVYR